MDSSIELSYGQPRADRDRLIPVDLQELVYRRIIELGSPIRMEHLDLVQREIRRLLSTMPLRAREAFIFLAP